MSEARKLNEAAVKELEVPAKGAKTYNFAGAKIQGSTAPRGFGVRVTEAGIRSFVLRYWNPGEHLIVIGRYPDWKPIAAVNRARELRQEIDKGGDPLDERRKQDAADRNTVEAVCEEWNTREGGKIRTAGERMQAFARLVYPELKKGDAKKLTLRGKPIEDVKRLDLVRLLDQIEDENGPVMADRTLAYLSTVFN